MHPRSPTLSELATKISNSLGHLGERATEVPGLMLYRRTAPTVPNPSTYEPSLLVIAQGRIRVDLGKASYVFGQSRFLLTSLELPVVSQVITASKEAPYLAFFLKLDMSILRDILNTEKSGSTPSRNCHVRDQVPPDGEDGCLVAFQLREASACRAPGNDCRHESIYAAPPFSRPYGDESAAISKAASPACRAATHAHG
jgi:hypothetical protein